MDRTTAANYATIDGLRAFQNADPAAGISEGTGISANDLQAYQEEIMGVIEGAGLVGSAANLKQLLQAIRILGRIRLTQNTIFYVSATSGSDTTGNGTSTAPWQTLQYAINTLGASYDLGGYSATIACSGNFTAGVTVAAPLVGQRSPGSVVFDGGAAAQIAVANGSGFGCDGGMFTVQNFGSLTTSGSIAGGLGDVIGANAGTVWHQGNNFGSCANAHLATYGSGANIVAVGPYTISAGGIYHLAAGLQGAISVTGGEALTVTLTGTPTFSTAFAASSGGGVIAFAGTSFTGGASGPKYILGSGGIILTNGGGANFFPGSVAGTNDGTGIYQ